MDKRKNLRNPDLLAHDYVSVLIQWDDAPSFIFRVAKVLGSSFPFNAEMLSITGSDSNLTVDFRFESSFDINTSPWQFELEVGVTAASVKFKPSAMYNASNNLIKVRFTIPPNIIPANSYLVFTAKRYRPSTQYLSELAAASASPVGIQGGGIETEIATGPSNGFILADINTLGARFTAPTTFTITKIWAPSNTIGVWPFWNIKILKLNASLPTADYNVLYEAYNIPNNNTNPNVSITINSGDSIAFFLIVEDSGGSLFGVPNTVPSYNTSILGFPVTFYGIVAGGTIDSVLTTIQATPQATGTARLFYGGAATWSNIIY